MSVYVVDSSEKMFAMELSDMAEVSRTRSTQNADPGVISSSTTIKGDCPVLYERTVSGGGAAPSCVGFFGIDPRRLPEKLCTICPPP